MSALTRLRPRRRRSEDGFTLVELMIASSVMVTALTMIAGVLTTGLSATAHGRERQSATGLANQVLEQLRATPMATLEAGMGSNDLATTTDSSISKAQGATCPTSGSGYTFASETIRCTTYTTDPVVTPLIPHVHTATVGPTTYNVATYLTYYNNNLTAGTYRATAVVSWASAVAGRVTKSVQAQTIIYTPPSGDTRCNKSFVPCQPAFTGDAVQTPATADLVGTVGSMSLDHILVSSGRATSDHPPAPWPLPGVRSAKPISSTLLRSGLSTMVPFVTTLSISSFSQRTSFRLNSLICQSATEPSA